MKKLLKMKVADKVAAAVIIASLLVLMITIVRLGMVYGDYRFWKHIVETQSKR